MLERIMLLAVLAAGFIALVLIGIVYAQAVNAQPLYSYRFELSLDTLVSIIKSAEFKSALINTLIVALLQTIVGVLGGLIIALAIHRVYVPYVGRLEPLVIAPFFIAPVIWGFAWNYAYGPSGYIPLLKGYDPFIVGVLCGLIHVPHAYALIASGLLSMDYSLEEVARLHGAGPLKAIVKVTIPMLRPSIILATTLLLILGFEQFGMPLVLLSPYGYDVLTTYMYGMPNRYPIDPYPKMAVVASLLLTITISLVILQRYLALREIRRFTTIGERYRGYYRMDVPLYIKLALTLIVLLYVIGAVLIPLGAVFLRSVNPLYGGGLYFTVDYYRIIVGSESYRNVITNTIFVALIAASLGSFLYLSYGWVILKGPRRAIRIYADILSTLPRALPGIVAGLAFLWLFLFTPLRPLMYTHLGLALAYAILWSTLGVRLIVSSLVQISQELENVARVHGASLTRTIIHIYIPLLKKSILISWLYLFILGIREYSVPVYLATGKTQVIGSTIVLLIGSGGLGIIAALSSITIAVSLVLTAIIFKIGWKPY